MAGVADARFYVGPDSHPDKYRLVARVGSGGEATLWRAEVLVAGAAETVAVKVLRPEYDPDFDRVSARWAEQAELLRFVAHPSVVRIREHFEGAPLHGARTAGEHTERSLYLVMNWADGQSLRDWMLCHPGREGVIAGWRILDQVADALELLHSGRATPSGRAFVHGDLSPGNVMIGEHEQAVLVDFGLVQVAGHRTRSAAGTPGFAAPEVWTHGEYTPAGDRYGFAALGYFVTTGSTPPSDQTELHRGLFGDPLLGGTGPEQVRTVMRGFSPDPAARPTPRVWLQELRGGATITARAGVSRAPATWIPAPSPVSPPAPSNRRRLVLAAGATVLALALIAGVIAGVRLVSSGGAGTRASAPPSPSVTVASPPAAAAPPTSSYPSPDTAVSGLPPVGIDLAGAPVYRYSVSGSPLQVANGRGLDLDSTAPDWGEAATGTAPGRLDVFYLGDIVPLPERAPGAAWVEGNRVTSPLSGAEALSACPPPSGYYSDRSIEYEGDIACVLTDQGRTAVVRVVQLSAESLYLDVVVWDRTG